MTNQQLYEQLEQEARRASERFADIPDRDYAARWTERANWYAEMADGYRQHGEDWLPF